MSGCAHGRQSRLLSDGTNVGRCLDCSGESSYFGNSVECSACYVGRLHTREQHDARVQSSRAVAL